MPLGQGRDLPGALLEIIRYKCTSLGVVPFGLVQAALCHLGILSVWMTLSDGVAATERKYNDAALNTIQNPIFCCMLFIAHTHKDTLYWPDFFLTNYLLFKCLTGFCGAVTRAFDPVPVAKCHACTITTGQQ